MRLSALPMKPVSSHFLDVSRVGAHEFVKSEQSKGAWSESAWSESGLCASD